MRYILIAVAIFSFCGFSEVYRFYVYSDVFKRGDFVLLLLKKTVTENRPSVLLISLTLAPKEIVRINDLAVLKNQL